MRVLIALDKFKDAITATEACETVAAALLEVNSSIDCDRCPLTDGGEGFAEILTVAAGGHLARVDVNDARGRRVAASIGYVRAGDVPARARRRLDLPMLADSDKIAVVDMASASGLALLPLAQRDPWQASSFGTGEAMRQAAESGSRAILLGVGGSATHDLGLGALAALGWAFCSTDGREIEFPTPSAWPRLVAIKIPGGEALPPIRIACDVLNPLLGDRGAAAVYAPQKGLGAGELPAMEAETARLARIVCEHARVSFEQTQRPGMGAAGGTAFGLAVLAGAQLISGSELVAEWLSLDARIDAADVIVTGEGRFDASSLEGKGPGAVIARAIAQSKTLHVFVGAASIAAPPGMALHVITRPGQQPLAVALAACAGNLRDSIKQVFAQM